MEADRDREESPEPPSSTESNGAYNFPPTHDLQDAFHFTPNTSPQLVMSASSAKAFTIVPLTVHSKTLPPIVNAEQGTSRGGLYIALLLSPITKIWKFVKVPANLLSLFILFL
ncbi:unnamed protein product [Strongylus vulgaris]|uniref:Uncharacterized protein n=1 Tax=Strongylus vulgaris TaxID=40348 RepID=A0A3P7K1H6_STRVU|nr:unnamed protein product [Strongylus vulgaris]